VAVAEAEAVESGVVNGGWEVDGNEAQFVNEHLAREVTCDGCRKLTVVIVE
jgi:hypothetical protein